MQEDNSNRLYVPLGSIGSGCLGIDYRGRFYNDILNPIGQGPVMPDSFPVLRASFGQGEPYVRALCCALEGEKESINQFAPLYLKKEEYQRRVSYPVVSCQLRDEKAPVRVVWSCFSPLAPYDHVASVMPCILLSVHVTNPTNRPVLCSLMFCMNNLTTEIGDDGTQKPAQIHFIRVEATENDNRSHLGTSLFRGAIADAQPELLKSFVRNAVMFGDRRNISADARPHLCLGVKEQLDAVISRGIWDPESPANYEYFWKVFQEKGVAAPPRPGTLTRAGSVCSAAKILPGASCRFDFLFAWHIPPGICEEMGTANGSMQHFPNAPESIRYGLRHWAYLYKAVTNWQKQLSTSGLPEEFSNALIDSTRAFVTYSRHQKKNGFTLLTQVGSDKESEEAWDFLRAFTLLTFAPRFHAAAVTTALTQAQEESAQAENLKEAAFQQRCAEIILSAYADVLYTGNRARFRDWYPRIITILNASMNGLLEKLAASDKTDTPISATITGLWAAAMNAIVLMGIEQNDDSGTQKREQLRQALAAGYRKQLAALAETANSGKLATTTHVPALAGACYAELLNLSTLAPTQSIDAILPKTFDAAAANASNDEQLRHNRMLIAIARALFNTRSITQEAATMKPFLTDLLKYETNITTGRTILPNRLGLWAVLQSLSGVYYDSLHHSLTIRPSSLADLNTTLPIFTPVSLGKMDVQIEKGQEQILVLRIALDTPLTIESIALRLPVFMHSVRASCVHDAEPVITSQELLPGDGGGTRIALRFKSPLKLTDMLTIRLRESSPQRTQ